MLLIKSPRWFWSTTGSPREREVGGEKLRCVIRRVTEGKMEVSALCSLQARFAFCLGCVHNKKIIFF